MRNQVTMYLMGVMLVFGSCKTDKSTSCNQGYNQAALFTNTADQVIIPALNMMQDKMSQLDGAIQDFTDNPTMDNKATAQQKFRDAYIQWQQVEYLNFGPSEAVQLNQKMNNFPLNVALLEANIQFGTYDLDAADNYYSGFPAMDYLLFVDGEASLEKFTTDADAATYKSYLNEVSELMLSNLNTVKQNWDNGYKNDFINNTGTADGSSISLLLNALNENFETTKRDRLGIPSGYHEINVPSFPDRVEGNYSQLSETLLRANITAAQNLFRVNNNSNAESLMDYVGYSEATKEGVSLDIAINNQFEAILDNLDNISSDYSNDLSLAIENSDPALQSSYAAMANQVVYMKTDMPSALCVSITYIDNASDSD